MPTLPVFKYSSLDSPVVFFQDRAISLGEILYTVDYLADKIPAHQHLLNLYEERYYFLLGFLLGLKQQSISLFPSTVTPHVLTHLKDSYNDILVLSEQAPLQGNLQTFDLKVQLRDKDFLPYQQNTNKENDLRLPEVELNTNVAIIFTSGSTGQPKPYIKQWNDLLIASEHLTHTLFSDIENKNQTANTLFALLATVPAQHMYGLEASIMVALQNGFLIHSDKAFFPQDITHCLEELMQFALSNDQNIETHLITTPLHLKACIKTEVLLPGIKQFISATAPLETELAQSCEQLYGADVMEIFGCTEVGSMAYRRTVQSDQWTVLDDINLKALDEHEIQINTTRSIKQFLFNDVIELLDEHHFILKGRKEDLINIAGKRTSLAYLNHHLQSYNELNDACFYQSSIEKQSNTQNKKNKVSETRLVAFVVLNHSESIDAKDKKQITTKIRSHLQQSIETVFLPKKIYFVESLPRNPTGKLPQSELKKLMHKMQLQEKQ